MSENDKKDETIDSENDKVEELTPPADDASEEDKADYVRKLESNNKQLFARTKKAEGFILKDGKWVKPVVTEKKDEKTDKKDEKKPEATTQDSELSQADLITLMKADVNEEDIETLKKFAKFENISIADALNNEILKGMLEQRAEARKIADATNTGGGKRGNANMSDEALLENARKGIFPENEADMARLTRLGRGSK